jgi:hypothetical protein
MAILGAGWSTHSGTNPRSMSWMQCVLSSVRGLGIAIAAHYVRTASSSRAPTNRWAVLGEQR